MNRVLTALLATLLSQPAAAEMFREWGVDRDNSDRVFLKSCSGATEAAPFGGGAFAPCIDVTCDPAAGLFLTVAVPNDGTQRDLRATVYAEGRDKGRFTFSLRPETPGFHSAELTVDEARALLEDLAKSVAMTVLFEKPPMKDLQTLRSYPMDGAARAIPEFLSSCLLMNGGAVLPEPSLPSFVIEDDEAPTAEPSEVEQPPAAVAGQPSNAVTSEGAAVVDPARLPPGFVAGMPLTFAPDPGAPTVTPADDPTRFIALPAAALPDQAPEMLVDALMADQKIDFAARYSGVPVVSGDLVVFIDGKLILSAVFCVEGQSGDTGCETWTMTTPGGGAPFAVSSRGLPSERPLWIDLKGPGKDGWPDLLVQDAAGAWIRLAWTGTGYF